VLQAVEIEGEERRAQDLVGAQAHTAAWVRQRTEFLAP
jgi:hypothetical protein